MENQNGEILGFYIGYKIYNASAPYIYLRKPITELQTTQDVFNTGDVLSSLLPEYLYNEHRYLMVIDGLDKFTQYVVHIQAYNDQGAGPRSDAMVVFTLEDGKLQS